MTAPADRTNEIEFHTNRLERAYVARDFVTARGAFAALVESWKQHNALHNGSMQDQVDAVKLAYSNFVRIDPLYQSTLKFVMQAIQNQPGILQTEIYTVLSVIPKDDLMYTLYFAADHGFIVRTKKGRTYSLSISTKDV